MSEICKVCGEPLKPTSGLYIRPPEKLTLSSIKHGHTGLGLTACCVVCGDSLEIEGTHLDEHDLRLNIRPCPSCLDKGSVEP